MLDNVINSCDKGCSKCNCGTEHPCINRCGEEDAMQLQTTTIRITKNGTVQFVYADGHPALELGKADIRRFSDVRYDNKDNQWKIFFNKDGKEIQIGKPHKTRGAAINQEVDIINNILSLPIEEDANVCVETKVEY
jgi:hypothetical protein